MASDDPDALFQRLVERFAADPDVTPPTGGTGFGANGLKAGGRIFAMLVEDELVVKLPKARVDELVDAGTAARFDPGHGRIMREWATVGARHGGDWEALADEARRFVGGAAR